MDPVKGIKHYQGIVEELVQFSITLFVVVSTLEPSLA
jgi:hypothetical protein